MAFDIGKLNNSSFRGIPFYTREDNTAMWWYEHLSLALIMC